MCAGGLEALPWTVSPYRMLHAHPIRRATPPVRGTWLRSGPHPIFALCIRRDALSRRVYGRIEFQLPRGPDADGHQSTRIERACRRRATREVRVRALRVAAI